MSGLDNHAFHQLMASQGLLSLSRPTPIQKLNINRHSLHSTEHCQRNLFNPEISLAVKREDLRHTYLSGNKWHKLKQFMALSLLQSRRPILSFGGAHSNHIHALAAAGCYFDMPTIGIIRASSTTSSPTLKDAAAWGMHLIPVSRGTYRRRHELVENTTDTVWLDQWQTLLSEAEWRSLQVGLAAQWNNKKAPIVIPEGGAGRLALLGVADLAKEICQQVRQKRDDSVYNHWVVAVGTGITLAGLVAGLHWLGLSRKIKVTGISVLRGERFLEADVAKYLTDVGVPNTGYQICHQFHQGGYARTSQSLQQFADQMQQANWPVDLDPIYNLKLAYAISQLQHSGYWREGDKVLMIHTGGLQGNRSYRWQK